MENDVVNNLEAVQRKIAEELFFIQDMKKEASKVMVGQDHLWNSLLIALVSGGHVLLEGLPGLAKTLVIKTLARTIDAQFSRIQFTPDLLPSDVVGTMVYNPGKNEFYTRKGPIFANLVLADEINRAPAKVQSALLEAMQERQVTIGHDTFKLSSPFMVLATQNPIEQEGTYPLPEAQTDRFMMKIKVAYPGREDEKMIIRKNLSGDIDQVIHAVANTEQILSARNLLKSVYLDEKIEHYILDIIEATRYPDRFQLNQLLPYIQYGGSPRASIYLAKTAKAHAMLENRAFVMPEDVRAVCNDVLRHRVALSFEAEAENVSAEDIIATILNKIQVP
jgi:MoxR-like ATPase